jgi:hypothetical protein
LLIRPCDVILTPVLPGEYRHYWVLLVIHRYPILKQMFNSSIANTPNWEYIALHVIVDNEYDEKKYNI